VIDSKFPLILLSLKGLRKPPYSLLERKIEDSHLKHAFWYGNSWAQSPDLPSTY
jgi:hypothetical protein